MDNSYLKIQPNIYNLFDTLLNKLVLYWLKFKKMCRNISGILRRIIGLKFVVHFNVLLNCIIWEYTQLFKL